jgi:[acyl-carrier-protein] S-malonyltransferase
MAAIIGEDRPKVAELCTEFGIEAANFNAPGQIIVSGEKGRVGSGGCGRPRIGDQEGDAALTSPGPTTPG